MDADKIIGLLHVGEEGCNHYWVYNSSNKMIISFPPHFINLRICEICGRVEEVDRANMTMGNEVVYTETCEKFHVSN